jgi:glutamine---fructose-6-phosphate transaminase (isomerizing)
MNNHSTPITNFELLYQDLERQAQLIEERIPSLRSEAIRVAKELSGNPSRVYLVGCGDSLNVGMATRFVWERLLDKPVEAIPAMTFSRYAVDTAPEGSLVVALSQSGSVTRVVEAVRVARNRKLKTLAITGKRNSTLALEPADATLIFDFPKLGFLPGTTSYSIGLVLYYELAAAFSIQNAEAQLLRENINGLPSIIRETVNSTRITAEQHASAIRKDTPILVLGSGTHLATAHFTARKFFEVTQSRVFSQETEEYAHDEYSIIDDDFACLLYAPPDRSFTRSKEIARYLDQLGLHLSVVTDRNSASEFEGVADVIYQIPDTPNALSPVTYAIPSQWLCYYCAKRLGGSYYATADPIHNEDGDIQIYKSEIITD